MINPDSRQPSEPDDYPTDDLKTAGSIIDVYRHNLLSGKTESFLATGQIHRYIGKLAISSAYKVDPDQGELFGLSEVEARVPYKLLEEHHRTNGSLKDGKTLRTEYLHLTDNLIYKMVKGVDVKNPRTNEDEVRVPDYVVWLDKSARPVSWLTKELWPFMAADKDGNVPPMPKFMFANIDREQWVNYIDPEGTGLVNTNRVDDSILRGLRSLYVEPRFKKDGVTEHIDTAPAILDNKTVLIVDEVNASGKTLQIASDFYKRAFPTCAIAETHWMGGKAFKGQAEGNADLPVWYDEKTELGRGVGDRNDRKSLKSVSLTQRLGNMFLSTRLHEKDPASEQLRAELHQLALDAKNQKIIFRPSRSWSEEEGDERITRYTGLSIEEFVQHTKARDKKR